MIHAFDGLRGRRERLGSEFRERLEKSSLGNSKPLNRDAFKTGAQIDLVLLAGLNLMEAKMSSVKNATIYDELLDILAEGADLERLLAFRLPVEKQSRLDVLLERNREKQLSGEDSAELDTFEHIEHVVRLLKAHLLQKHKQ